MADKIIGINLNGVDYDYEDEETSSQAEENASKIGNLAGLETTAKTDLVSAINEVKRSASTVGDLADLETTAKTDLVSAINEVNEKAESAQATADDAGKLETRIPIAVDGVSGLGSDPGQFRIGGRMVFGEIVVNILTDVAPSTAIATGLFPAFRAAGYHFCVRSTVSGVMRSDIPVYVGNDGGLYTSGSAPTLHAGDQLTFSIPYYSTATA